MGSPIKVIYIAGAYTGKFNDHRSYAEIDRNICAAREAAAELANAGVGFFCPHTHSAHFEVITPDVSGRFWYDLDITLLRACDAIYLLPGWQNSKGSVEERRIAENELDIPVFEHLPNAIAWARRPA